MHLDARKVLQARDVGPVPAREEARGGYEDVAPVVEDAAFVRDLEIPDALVGVELCVHDLVRELDVAREIVFCYCTCEVGLDFGAAGVEGGPVGVGLEGDFLGASVGGLSGIDNVLKIDWREGEN